MARGKKKKRQQTHTLQRPKAKLLSNSGGVRRVLEGTSAARAALAALSIGVLFEQDKNPLLYLIQSVQLSPRPFWSGKSQRFKLCFLVVWVIPSLTAHVVGLCSCGSILLGRFENKISFWSSQHLSKFLLYWKWGFYFWKQAAAQRLCGGSWTVLCFFHAGHTLPGGPAGFALMTPLACNKGSSVM